MSMIVSRANLSLGLLALCLACPSVLAQPAAAPPAAAAPSAAQGAATVTTSDGVALAYTAAGQGIPCLFVHGGPGSGSEVVQRLAGEVLEKRFRMVYLDQRGSGRSASDPHKDYSLERVVQDMEELRASLKIDKWVLMPHSFGGIIATAYARKHPDRVAGMVLMNGILHLPASMESTVTHGYALLPADARPPLDPAAPLPQRFGMVMGLLGQARLTGRLMYADPATEARVGAAMRGLAANRDFASTLFASGAIAGYAHDMAPATAGLAMPVLVISGKEDHVSGAEHYRSFRFPRQQVVLVPGRHFSMIEQPAEVGRALDGFAASLRALAL
ncbi:alpha/beta hydrolase [Massilia oculi]|uniref:Alpha/beta hydrolase n=1 Tax=Massilia hydrophila TaxID=3044279 RepID=A0ABS7Y5W5_9BURK|nr:alpha/beta hydrolase [Massilia oculi]MCA1855062.1 alpha/beta hydrolase [Massilia oculi]